MNAKTLDQLFQQIALSHLSIDTLETRHSDRLDFHEVSVWDIKSALQAAFDADYEAVQQVRARKDRLGAFVELVPSEHSSGQSRSQGSISKTGNTHARRLLVEAA